MQVGICYSLCRSKSSTELMLSVSKREVKQNFFIFIFLFAHVLYIIYRINMKIELFPLMFDVSSVTF